MSILTKIEKHKAFWDGDGPSLILIPTGKMEAYDTVGYRDLFYNPDRMWESEIKRARPALDWPTDGIPCVRPNLGTIFVPTMAGLGYQIREGQMPWPGEHLDPEAIRAGGQVDLAGTELMQLATEFYRIHFDHNGEGIAAYHADTQGVFDIAHLLYGSAIFYDLADESKADWINELLDICLDLYIRASQHLKKLLGEESHSMVHGHGNSQGAYFPQAGVRMAEDTPILISPAMIERVVLPSIQKAAEPFGGVFVHYCGGHKPLFQQLCGLECVRAIDLGNPEMYDTRWLLELCAETGKVLYSGIGDEPDESWETYTRRVGNLVKETGARCILRPKVFPETREECADMLSLWHELTG